ncbi:MAG: hypothetical protein HQ519_00045 [Planctomycetes bacterium]|nr:hypothetical protein [Planctomycetota bacterium]
MQAPQTPTDFWFLVAQGLLGILLLSGGWLISYLVRQIKSLAETVSNIDSHHTEERLKLEMKFKDRLSDLRTDFTVQKTQRS